MGADHTPGPWTGIHPQTIYRLHGEDDSIIADVYESEANARLIAAAPDLLAALQDTVQVFEGLDRASELHETLYPVLANLRTAIAAAKGEA